MYYEYGISAWLALSLPYTLFALMLAIFFAKRARKFEHVTIADLLDQKFGRKISNLAAVLLLIVNSPAMYLLMAGQIIAFVWDAQVWVGVLFSAVFSTVYLYRGGFKALIKTDVLQFALMFIGFGALVFVLWNQNGAPEPASLPDGHLNMSFTGSAWELIAWFMLAAFTFIDPNYYQRMSAASTSTTARNGILIAVGFWTLFDFLAASVALYGMMQFPDLAKPETIYLEIGHLALADLPLLEGIFFVGLLSAVLSTADSMIFYAGISISRDLLHRNGFAKTYSAEQLTRIGLILITILGAGIALLYSEESVIDLFFDLHPLAVSALVIPVVLAYGNRPLINSTQAFATAVVGASVWIIYTGIQKAVGDSVEWLADVNAIFPGLLLTGILLIVFAWRNR